MKIETVAQGYTFGLANVKIVFFRSIFIFFIFYTDLFDKSVDSAFLMVGATRVSLLKA